jgi:hypothetical protein
MLETMENTTNNMNSTNLLAELVEARVALAKSEMQLEWQKLKDHSKPEPEVMAPLFEALAKAQAEFESVTATSRVTFKNVDFKFAPLSDILAAVRPALNKYGLTLTQQTKHIPFGNANGVKVVTTLLHESGVSYDIESVPVFYNVNDIKNLGAQVTYLRRYEVKTLLGIEADSEELDMDNVPNVPNHSQSTQQTGNYENNHNYQSNAKARTPRKPTGARYGKTAQSASLATSLNSSEQTSLSEVTSANKVASDSVSQATSEAESSSQTSETATQPKGTKTACNDDQLIQMVARGEEAALSLGATESQLLEWSELGESQGLTVQLKALSDFVAKQRQQAQQQ